MHVCFKLCKLKAYTILYRFSKDESHSLKKCGIFWASCNMLMGNWPWDTGYAKKLCSKNSGAFMKVKTMYDWMIMNEYIGRNYLNRQFIGQVGQVERTLVPSCNNSNSWCSSFESSSTFTAKDSPCGVGLHRFCKIKQPRQLRQLSLPWW